MSDWQPQTTDALAANGVLEIGDGYRAKNVEFRSLGGLPFVRVGNIGNQIALEDLDELPNAMSERLGPKVSQPHDSLITMKGTVGRVAYVRPDLPRFVYSPQISYWRSKDHQVIDPRWLRYWLESPEFSYQALATKGSTDMADYINLRDQRRMRITIPPKGTQQRIASILGSIDDLIENNRRRIEVLGEMAQAIYREWFVHFRLPGHEDATFVDSPLGPIPDGWEVSPFSDVATFTNGFAFKPAHFQAVGRPVIKIKELKQGVTSQTPRCPAGEIKDKYWIEPGDLLFSWSADLGIYLWNDEPGLLNQHLFKVTPSGHLSVTLLCHMLQESLPGFRERAQGTTMKHIKRSALDEVITVVPERRVVDSASQTLDDYDSSVRKLSATNDRIASIRDLLLPKLVTGEIDVSDLDLDALVGAAG